MLPMTKQEETQRRLSERISESKIIEDLMDILKQKVIEGQGFVHSNGMVYAFTEDGTKIYTEEEFAKINGNNTDSH